MGSTETRQERRASEREKRKGNAPNAYHDADSTFSQPRHVVPLVLSCLAGMILALAGSKFLTPDRKKVSATKNDTDQQGQTTPSGKPPEASGKSYADLLVLDAKDINGMDLAELNLICGSGLAGTERADIRQHLKRLDEMAAMVRAESGNPANLNRWKTHRPANETSESIFKMRILVQVLKDRCGIHYNEQLAELTGNGVKPTSYKEWDDKFYSDASVVFLHGLLSEKHEGSCVSMPVLYTVVARRLGYPVFLAMSKGHLFCRWDSPEERFNIEGTGAGGMTPYPDTFYQTFPNRLSEWELKNENYLQSLTPAEELALFLKTRAVCLSTQLRHDEGLVALAQAVRLAKKRGLPGLDKQMVMDGYLPAGTRRAIEQPMLDQRKPMRNPPSGHPQQSGK